MHASGHFGELLRKEDIPFAVIPLHRTAAKVSRNGPIVKKLLRLCKETTRLSIAVARLARHWRIDVIHANHLYGYAACGIAAKRMRIPCIWHLHEGWHKNAVSGLLEHVGPLLTEYVVTIAPFEQSTVAGLTRRVANGMIESAFDFDDLKLSRKCSRQEIRKEFGVKDGQMLIGYVSHLAPYKGQRTFVHAFNRLIKHGRTCKAIVVGGARKSFEWFREELVTEVRRLGISEHVSLCGTRLDLADVMEALDIFVCVSALEEFNRVLIEAMCFGKPVIAVDIRGGSIVAEHGITGLLVPPNDDLSLSDALETLLDNADLRARLGRNGQMYACERFSIRNILPKYECLYDSVLAR
jgi:glycosyltransferase involved in cell wall biosynthesis